MEILEDLNDVQKQALLQTKGAVLVTAGAGSGKTKLLTHRIAYLVGNQHVDEDRILAITFTNKAANEMKDRVDMLLHKSNGVWISTFHSMCLRILRRYIDRLEGYTSDFSIYSETDAEKTLKQVIKDLNLSLDDYKLYSYVISDCQNENIDIQDYTKNDVEKQEELVMVYDAYEKALKKNNALDFDHLLTKTYELFACNKDILNYFANRFEYVFVDEFQDTNKVQYDLIKMLTSVHHNVFVVGDEDQCIYTWRGANFRNIFNFKNDFAPVKMFKLEQNYRCTKNILEKANKLIKYNTERFDKVLWTDNDSGKNVEIYSMYDEQTEAESVISKIIALKNSGNYQYKDMAVLMRLNALTLPFEQKFLNYNIPYRIYGGFKFYERQEIKNIISYLRLFCNPNDDTSVLRIINFPKRAIGDVAISKLRTYAKIKDMSLLMGMVNLYNHSEDDSALCAKIKGFIASYLKLKEEFGKTSLDEFCKHVIDEFNIKSAYMEKCDENTNKLMNLDTFVNSLYEFARDNENATLSEFLESITLETDLDFMGEDDTVTVSTVHSVKGLEFKVVFIVGMEDGIFPLSRCFESNSEMEEERRLLYVAMTRAKERLFLSCVGTRYLHGKRIPMLPSRFLEEADLKIQTRPSYQNNGYNSYNSYDSYGSYSSSYSSRPVYSNVSNNYTEHKSTNNFNSIKAQTMSTTLSNNGYVRAGGVNDTKEKKDTSIYKQGQHVTHPKFGKGEIMAIVDDGVCAEINFENFGKKVLILEIAPLSIVD